MTCFGILLDSGVLHVGEFYRSREAVMEAAGRWRLARETALKESSIVVPRRIAAIVRIRLKNKDRDAGCIGAMGGRARAKKLSPERRREIAKAAAEKRWGKR